MCVHWNWRDEGTLSPLCAHMGAHASVLPGEGSLVCTGAFIMVSLCPAGVTQWLEYLLVNQRVLVRAHARVAVWVPSGWCVRCN